MSLEPQVDNFDVANDLLAIPAFNSLGSVRFDEHVQLGSVLSGADTEQYDTANAGLSANFDRDGLELKLDSSGSYVIERGTQAPSLLSA